MSELSARQRAYVEAVESGLDGHLLKPDESAYRACACEHCPEIAIGTAGAVCGDCEAAGCTDGDCEREDVIFAEFFPADYVFNEDGEPIGFKE